MNHRRDAREVIESLRDFINYALKREPEDNIYSRGRRAAFVLVLEMLAQEEYRPFYTVDEPHRIVNLRETDQYGVLVDATGEEYEHWMVRAL